jgi:uncharacterized damage-inducible protein DinB
MTREVERIADQLRRSHEGDAWAGPALNEVLAGIPAARAAQRPTPTTHSIWQSVLHVLAWEKVWIGVLAGEPFRDLSEAENWPDVPHVSEAAWQQVQADLATTHATLREAILRFLDERLEELVAGKTYTYYVLLHGVVQHNLYHIGQIAVLKNR